MTAAARRHRPCSAQGQTRQPRDQRNIPVSHRECLSFSVGFRNRQVFRKDFTNSCVFHYGICQAATGTFIRQVDSGKRDAELTSWAQVGVQLSVTLMGKAARCSIIYFAEMMLKHIIIWKTPLAASFKWFCLFYM